MRDRLSEELLEQYEAFSLMLRSTAMLGTQSSHRFDRDAQSIIDLLGQVYGWRQELTDAAADLILGELMRLGLLSDFQALASAELLEQSVKDHLILYQLKGMALEETARSQLAVDGQHGDRSARELKSSTGGQTFHHVYEPTVRYTRLQAGADNGEPLATLETALLRLLGIGCERDLSYAQLLLERSLLWGAREAAKVLGFLWAREGDPAMVSFFQAVHDYLSTPSRLPEDPKAAEYCILIAAVRSTVRRQNGGSIDVLFADLMGREDIPFAEKLAWTARYKDGVWLRRCLTGQRTMKIGFLP